MNRRKNLLKKEEKPTKISTRTNHRLQFITKKNSSKEKAGKIRPHNNPHMNTYKQCPSTSPSRKEVFQPHLPVRLPCYVLAPAIGLALGRSLRLRTSGTTNSHGLTGGVYKARERIHRAVADARLLANPASRSRVADSDPN